MRPIALVTTLGGFVLLGIAGCGDDRSSSRDESWRDWPTSYPASDQPAGGGGAASSGSAAGYQPSTGPIDTGTIPAVSPQPGGDVRSGDKRDYRWDTSSESAPIGSSPGISGANYGGSTVIPDTRTSFSPRDPVIVGSSGGGGGSRGSSAGTQPGAANALTPTSSQSDTVPTGTFGLTSPERANVGGSGTINPGIGVGTTVIRDPLDRSGGTGFDVTQGTGTGAGAGGVTTTPGTGTSTGGFGVNGGFTTGAPGAGTGVVANPLSGSASTPEQGAITNPGAPGSNANVDPTATGATTAPGGAAPSGGPAGAASGMGAGGTTSGGAASGGGAAGGGGAGGG